MISTSAFKAFPDLPELAMSNGIKLELTKLIDQIHYSSEFIETIKSSAYSEQYIAPRKFRYWN